MAQWLGLCAFTAEGAISILGWGTKIPQIVWHSQNNNNNNNKKELADDLAIPLLSMYNKGIETGVKNLYMNVHSSTIDNSQKVETSQMPIN